MGRLFWRFFFACWVALVLAAVGAGVAVSVLIRAGERPQGMPGFGPHQMAIDLAAATLQHGGVDALRAWLAETQRKRKLPLLAVDSAGHDLLGRSVPQESVQQARKAAAARSRFEGARMVTVGSEHYILFVPKPRVGPLPPRFPWILIVTGALASLVVSALLAWYMARPIRNLRWALGAVADGKLDTRVAPLMGSRRDEVADLGRDFDRMAEQLQRLMAGQRNLLHDVSHELRSPLARLEAAVGLIRQDPQRLDASLERIELEAARLDKLVGEVLTLARLDSGVVSERSEPVNFDDIVADIVEDAKFEAETCGRSVSFCVDGEHTVMGRAELLHRAVDNIVRNALRHTAEGTTVNIDLERDPEQVRSVLTVRDAGPGMREDELEHLFLPFFRAESSHDGEGFGLGLAIAKRAIDLHDGHIAARNRTGGGLCVSIKLPLAKNKPAFT